MILLLTISVIVLIVVILFLLRKIYLIKFPNPIGTNEVHSFVNYLQEENDEMWDDFRIPLKNIKGTTIDSLDIYQYLLYKYKIYQQLKRHKL